MQNNTSFNTSVIRPQLVGEDIKLKRPLSNLDVIKKSLQTLHRLELMAFNIYRFQITREKTELNRQLIIAMANEMTHYQDFQIKLFEYGFKPSAFRWLFGFLGFVLGLTSRIRGYKAVLKTNIRLESKAIHHYNEILKAVEWDDETRKVIEKDQMDENIHINRWQNLLQAET